MTDEKASGEPPADSGETAYTDLWSRPGFLIRRLHQLHAALFLEECRAYEVTPVQYAILSVLYRGRALDQVSVAGEVGIDRTNAADVIRRLERRGHVERIANPGDRRKRLARITPEGRRFVEGAHGAMERAQRRLTDSLSDAETGRLMDLMRKMTTGNHGTGRPHRRQAG